MVTDLAENGSLYTLLRR